MKKILLIILFVWCNFMHAQVGAKFTSATSGTLSGYPFTISGMQGEVLATQNLAGAKFSGGPLSTTQQVVSHQNKGAWEINFETPIPKLRLYCKSLRTTRIKFNQPFKVLSGGFIFFEASGNVLDTNQYSDGIIEFDNPVKKIIATVEFGGSSNSIAITLGLENDIKVHVPDDNFEQALIDLGYDDVLDNYVLKGSIYNVSILKIGNKNISDLTGIEEFKALRSLIVSNNKLKELDLSNNLNLRSLSAANNLLTSINTLKNTLLESLIIEGNNISSINIENNTVLKAFTISDSPITSLNIEKNTALTLIKVENTMLTSLDVSKNTSLETFHATNSKFQYLDLTNNTDLVSVNTLGNTDLYCIKVNNATQSTVKWPDIDSQSYFSETCSKTYVPDNNFEQTLIDLGYDNILDDYVYTENINTLTSLDLSSKGIFKATGIQDFIALETLNMSDNFISSAINFSTLTKLKTLNISNNASFGLSGDVINVSGCTLLETLNISACNMSAINLVSNINLKTLHASANNISTINLSNCSNLTYANISGSNLSAIDVSNATVLNYLNVSQNKLAAINLNSNSGLVSVYLQNNKLASLNIKNGTNTSITNFNASNNPGLVCILVDDSSYSTTNWTNIDSASMFSQVNCDLTYIPDDNFEQALIDFGIVTNTVIDDYVLTSEISGKESLIIGGKSISDFTGIEGFTALKDLNLGNNNVAILDLSSNLALQSLKCNDNPLTSLNITQNTALTLLKASQTNLASIDASNNTILTSINVKNCVNLASLNLQNGNNINMSGGNFTGNNNPNLKCIQVDNAVYSTTNWTTIDSHSFFSTASCNVTYVPDDNFEQRLINLGYDDVLNNYVVTNNINTLNTIDLRFQGIIDMTGIEGFSALKTLQCQVNSINNIDISNNTNLKTVYCDRNNISTLNVSTLLNLELLRAYDNNLTSLDVTNNLQLENLNITNNAISSLDLSNNTKLAKFNASNTALSTLDFNSNTLINELVLQNNSSLNSLSIKNGNNTGVATFNTTGNANLFCIEVDDVTYSTTNWTNIDMHINFNTNCHYGQTYVPDNAFEQVLINYGLDNVLDDYVLTDNINALTSFGLNNTTITDLTGLQDFTALKELTIANNPNITSVDLSKLTQLTEITFENNQIASVDISKNVLLKHLTLRNNNLTSIDVSNNSELLDLQLSGNSISNLDLSNLSKLTFFTCNRNPISTIVLTNNPLLTYLGASNTNLTTVDFSNNSMLNQVYLRDNNMSSLDFSNNPAIKYLFASNSSISSINIGTAGLLEKLELNNNNLNSLDVSSAVKLTELYVNNNNLIQLDLATNTRLNKLDASHNKLEHLDLTKNKDGGLSEVIINNNALKSFTIKGGDNSGVNVFNTLQNPNLTCIQVDNAIYSSANWVNIDTQTSFNEFCPEFYTYVPDNNFEQALIDLGYDDGLNDYVLTKNINSITQLILQSKSIRDATGIEDFIALTDLRFRSNNLSTIDVSSLTKLKTLDLRNNNISSLNVSKNTLLESLNINNNGLTNLDLTKNTELKGLGAENNNLTSIDVSNNLNLQNLDVGLNSIGTVDITNNQLMKVLEVQNCGLTTINLTANNSIEELYIENNNLNVLSVTNMTNLTTLSAGNNNISVMDVSNNLQLEWLAIADNNLLELNVSNSTDLSYLEVQNNKLTSFNVKNGNNTAFSKMYATGNTNLTCIEVDNETGAYLTATASGGTLKWQKDITATYSESCLTLGLSKETVESIKIHPNPTSGIIQLTNINKIEFIDLYTITGQSVKKYKIQDNIIDITNLSDGVYFIKIKTNKGVITKKIIKQ